MNQERYTRQIILGDFGPEAQQRLYEAKVLVVGAGGLGVPVLTYLNAMGVGTLGIVDADVISLTNLHRQVLYDENHIGEPKVNVAISKLKAQNPNSDLIAHQVYLTKDNAISILKNYDVIIDATDNFPSRYLINDACVILNKPFVYGALHGFEGQVSVFNHNGGPTYRCLFPTMPSANEVPNCNEHGVLGIIPGIIGNLQALETIKVLSDIGKVLSGKLLLYNGLDQTFQKIGFPLVPSNLKISKLQSVYDFECGSEQDFIEANDLETLLKKKQVQVIDVRTSQEFDTFHLENTLNRPLDEISDWKEQLDYENSIYLLCQSGVRSHKAIEVLKAHNPNATYVNVKGGINKLRTHAVKY